MSKEGAQGGNPPVAGVWQHRLHGPLAAGHLPAVHGRTSPGMDAAPAQDALKRLSESAAGLFGRSKPKGFRASTLIASRDTERRRWPTLHDAPHGFLQQTILILLRPMGTEQQNFRNDFVHWLAGGAILRGWARSVSGDTAEGIPSIEHGIRDLRATGSVLGLPYDLALKAEALHLADRTSEALQAIEEAEAVVQKIEERQHLAELNRLRGVFLASMGGDETQVEASFFEAMRIAKEQKSISLEKRAQATYAEYRRQKASASGGQELRLPLS
jgi:hypothetical protein